MLLTMNPPSAPWPPVASQQLVNNDVVPQYTDFANVPDMVSSFCADEAARKSIEQFFPVKLHILLNELEKDGRSDIVGWSPHGRAFHVHKQEKFVSEIIPRWFRQTGYASFRRQLNLYGFRRITSGRDKGAYYHPLFLRSKCFLADRMERVKLTGPVPKGRKRNAPESEPNFYLMKPLPPNENGVAHSAASTITPSLSTSSIASSVETGGSYMAPHAPRMTALDILQQQCLQNSLGQHQSYLGGGPQTSQLSEAQLAHLVRPLLYPQADHQQVHDLETQLLLQEQIKILRARLVAQILSRT